MGIRNLNQSRRGVPSSGCQASNVLSKNMKRKTLLALFGTMIAVAAIVGLAIDNLGLRHGNQQLEMEVAAATPHIFSVELTYTEVAISDGEEPEIRSPVILDSSEAQRILDALSDQKAEIVSFSLTSVPSGQNATFEIADRKFYATPTVGTDGYTIDLITSSASGGISSERTTHLLWTGQTVVIPSPKNAGSLMFVKAQIQSGQNKRMERNG